MSTITAYTTNVVDTTPKKIVDAFVKGLQRKLQMTDANCYPVAVPAYIEGSDRLTLQVAEGDQKELGSGQGYQEGNAINRLMDVEVAIWLQINQDQYRRSTEILQKEYDGLTDLRERIRFIFSQTSLGYLCNGTVKWKGAMKAIWADDDRCIVRSAVLFTAPFATDLPFTATLTDTDLA